MRQSHIGEGGDTKCPHVVTTGWLELLSLKPNSKIFEFVNFIFLSLQAEDSSHGGVAGGEAVAGRVSTVELEVW